MTRYLRASASVEYGQWMLRLFGRFFALKAPWCFPLFSERYRHGVRVIPLGFGWRVTVRAVPRDSDTHPQGGDAQQAPFMGSAGLKGIAQPLPESPNE